MARPRSAIDVRIQRAARAQFLVHGVDGASLRAIAAAAGTSIGMVYYYFPTKDDLFLAVVEEVYARLLGELAAMLAGGGTAREKVRRVYARLWRAGEDEYAIVRLVLREVMVSADRVGRLAPLFAQGHVPLLLGMLMEGVAAGELREEVPPAALLVSTMALGVMPMLAWRTAGEKVLPGFSLPDPDTLGALFSSVLFGGIGSKARKRGKPGKPKRSARR